MHGCFALDRKLSSVSLPLTFLNCVGVTPRGRGRDRTLLAANDRLNLNVFGHAAFFFSSRGISLSVSNFSSASDLDDSTLGIIIYPRGIFHECVFHARLLN